MPTDETNPTPLPLFPGQHVTKLLLNLKAQLGQVEGQSLSFDDWAQITGRPANTIASWCAGGAAHQLEVLLASMERLTEAERHRLINEACRDYPTLRHPKLAHDFVACSHLATLLRQPSGLTFIQGAPEHMRTFVLTALGHSAGSLDLKKRPVTGVDTHRAEGFVPVIGMIYLENLLRPVEIAHQFNRLWPTVRAKKAHLVLLNGIWRSVPTLQPDIMDAARTSHIIVADGVALTPGSLTNRVPTPAHLITVSPTRERPEWIRIEIQSI